ncbi:response regulator [Sulfurimonas sp.]|nr:response regulator [Sulfurimonas sp.]
MKITSKKVLEFSHTLKALYVEDDEELRNSTLLFLETFFESVDVAEDGAIGLEKYNENCYDVIISDINMPNMNGIEMSKKIHEINPDQKILVITAHNETGLLIDLIKNGISSFISKPFIQEEALASLYNVCRDARSYQLNEELFQELSEKSTKLENKIKELEQKQMVIEVKNNQVSDLLELNPSPKNIEDNKIVADYFEADEDEGQENVCFHHDDTAEVNELMEEGMELASLYCTNNNKQHLEEIGKSFVRVSSIFYQYTPFLDPLSLSMNDLGKSILENIDVFAQIFDSDPDAVFSLFSAIKMDIEKYLERFSVESMAMKNIHHIHHPTTLSIQQVVGLLCPVEIDEGEMEFF